MGLSTTGNLRGPPMYKRIVSVIETSKKRNLQSEILKQVY